MLRGFPSVRSSSLGVVYLLFALSSLRERLSCSLRLPPLPLPDTPTEYSSLSRSLSRSFAFPHATPEYNEQASRMHDYLVCYD